jgi:hypothetical protein
MLLANRLLLFQSALAQGVGSMPKQSFAADSTPLLALIEGIVHITPT